MDEKYPLTEHPNYQLMADSPGFDIKKYMAEKRRREERELSARIASRSKAKARRQKDAPYPADKGGKHYKSPWADKSDKSE